VVERFREIRLCVASPRYLCTASGSGRIFITASLLWWEYEFDTDMVNFAVYFQTFICETIIVLL
jgi:hypothetical protein